MGETFVVNSLDEMCDMMCDNVVPKRQCWIFTFGVGQEHEGFYVKIYGTHDEARKKMIEKYGTKWAFQYSEGQWLHWVMVCPHKEMIEKELETIGGEEE